MRGIFEDLTGRRFGRLLVIGRSQEPSPFVLWEVHCDCGQIRHVRSPKLTRGEHVSCGCLRNERMRERHQKCRVLIIDGKKRCSTCKVPLPISQFNKSTKTLSGLQPRCRKCSLCYDWKKKFGLTLEEARELLQSQGIACIACKSEGDLHLDHDHATGKIRGFLCGSCNRALGLLKDDPLIILRLLKYLQPGILNANFSDSQERRY